MHVILSARRESATSQGRWPCVAPRLSRLALHERQAAFCCLAIMPSRLRLHRFRELEEIRRGPRGVPTPRGLLRFSGGVGCTERRENLLAHALRRNRAPSRPKCARLQKAPEKRCFLESAYCPEVAPRSFVSYCLLRLVLCPEFVEHGSAFCGQKLGLCLKLLYKNEIEGNIDKN